MCDVLLSDYPEFCMYKGCGSASSYWGIPRVMGLGLGHELECRRIFSSCSVHKDIICKLSGSHLYPSWCIILED
jgi:hypothetical protein